MTKDSEESGLNCRECGQELRGRYCLNCGYDSKWEPRPLWESVAELWDELLGVNLRFFRTLVLLVTRPGTLSTEYLTGRRRGLTSPLRLYVTLTFIAALVTRGFSRAREVGAVEAHFSGAQLLYGMITILSSNVGTEAVEVSPAIYDLAGRVGPWVGLVLFSPVMATALPRVFRKTKRLFVEHLVVSIHFQSFVVLVVTLEAALLWILPERVAPAAAWTTVSVVVLYSALLLREFYEVRKTRLIGAWFETALFFYVGLVAVMMLVTQAGLPIVRAFIE